MAPARDRPQPQERDRPSERVLTGHFFRKEPRTDAGTIPRPESKVPGATGATPVHRAWVMPQGVACARPGKSRDLNTALGLCGRHQRSPIPDSTLPRRAASPSSSLLVPRHLLLGPPRSPVGTGTPPLIPYFIPLRCRSGINDPGASIFWRRVTGRISRRGRPEARATRSAGRPGFLT